MNFSELQRQVQGDFSENLENGRYVFRKTCSVSGKPYEVSCTVDQYVRWRNGGMIQNVMHDLSADQREFLISRQTPAEFEALFGEDE